MQNRDCIRVDWTVLDLLNRVEKYNLSLIFFNLQPSAFRKLIEIVPEVRLSEIVKIQPILSTLLHHEILVTR